MQRAAGSKVRIMDKSQISALVERIASAVRCVEWSAVSQSDTRSYVQSICPACRAYQADGAHTADCALVAADQALPVLLAALGESRGEGLEEAARHCEQRRLAALDLAKQCEERSLDAEAAEHRLVALALIKEAEAIRALSSKPSALAQRSELYSQAVDVGMDWMRECEKARAEVAALVAERDALRRRCETMQAALDTALSLCDICEDRQMGMVTLQVPDEFVKEDERDRNLVSMLAVERYFRAVKDTP